MARKWMFTMRDKLTHWFMQFCTISGYLGCNLIFYFIHSEDREKVQNGEMYYKRFNLFSMFFSHKTELISTWFVLYLSDWLQTANFGYFPLMPHVWKSMNISKTYFHALFSSTRSKSLYKLYNFLAIEKPSLNKNVHKINSQLS